jgi:O-antigen ligase
MQDSSGSPALASPAPIATAGFAGALLVGVLMARNVQLGVAMLLGLVYVPIVMLNLPLGLVLWIPLIFIDRLPATSFGPTLVMILVGTAWLGTLPARGGYVNSVLRRHQGLVTTLGLLLAWTTMSIAWARDPAAAADDFWNWWVAAAIFIVVATSISDRRYLAAACAAFVLGAIFSVLVGLFPNAVDRGTIAADEASRLGGSFGDPNFLAAGLVPAIALIPGLMRVWRDASIRWLLAGSALVLGIGLAATASRGGLVAGAVSIVAAIFLARGRRLQVGALVGLAVVVGGLWIATSSPATWDRVREFDTGNGRVDLWTVATRMAEAHPIAGVGDNNFRAASAEFVRQPGQLENVQLIVEQPHVVHNTYLQQLAETGIVGISLLIGFLLGCLRATWSAAKRFAALGDQAMGALSRSLLVAQIGVLSASVFMSNGYDKRIWVLLALGPAMLAVATRQSAHSESSS